MGERKVLSKYYPPDFDPSKLPRVKKPRDKDNAVRFMLPMSVRCTSCGSFMGQGLKFNARKSNTDEDYLGVRIYRFTMRCKQCPATFAIKTDPQNSDYTCESGVKRNFEPWRAKEEAASAAKQEREEADLDTMVALENKTMDAKSQMEELDALHELRSIKNVQATITPDAMLQKKRREEVEARKEVADEAELEMHVEAVRAFARKKSTLIRAGEVRDIPRPANSGTGQSGPLQSRFGSNSPRSHKSDFPKPLHSVRFKPKRNVPKLSSNATVSFIETVQAHAETPASAGLPLHKADMSALLDYSSSDSGDEN